MASALLADNPSVQSWVTFDVHFKLILIIGYFVNRYSSIKNWFFKAILKRLNKLTKKIVSRLLVTTSITEAKEKIKRAKRSISSAIISDSFVDVIEKEKEAFVGLHILYASDNGGLALQEAHNSSPNWVSIFNKRYLLAWSDEIAAMHEANRKPQIAIVSRPLIDTNLWSDLPKVLLNQKFDSRMKAERTLRDLWQHFGKDNLDWTFGTLENMREASKPDNPFPARKISASRYYLTHGVTFTTEDSLAKYETQSKKDWASFLSSDFMWRQVHRRDFVYLIVLKTFLFAWQGLTTADAFRSVCQYCLTHFKTMPLKELYFSWKILRGFSEPTLALKAFSEGCMKTPSQKTLNRLRALAWDLYLFRWYETQMTEKINLGIPDTFAFYVPSITTLDEPLLQVLHDCQLQALIIDYANGIVETVFADDAEFNQFLAEAITPELHIIIDDAKRQKMANQILPQEVENFIAIHENEISDLINVAAT